VKIVRPRSASVPLLAPCRVQQRQFWRATRRFRRGNPFDKLIGICFPATNEPIAPCYNENHVGVSFAFHHRRGNGSNVQNQLFSRMYLGVTPERLSFSLIVVIVFYRCAGWWLPLKAVVTRLGFRCNPKSKWISPVFRRSRLHAANTTSQQLACSELGRMEGSTPRLARLRGSHFDPRNLSSILR
jgi:hypothetical protein